MSQEPIDVVGRVAGVLVVTLVSSAALSEITRRLAWKFGIVDIPGGRRLHRSPTPRGGGAAIALAWSMAVASLGAGAGPAAAALVGTSLGFALLGLVDDIRPLPSWFRLVAQVALVSGPPLAALAGGDVAGGAAGWWLVVPILLLVLFVVNAFNFVDGADGLVPLQALCITIGLLLVVEPGPASSEWLASWQLRELALVAAVAGFLPFNWPRARLFLGDVGSLLLGSVCVGAALEAILRDALRPDAALVLFAVVVIDPAWTLLRRTLRRAPILQAHLEHGYHRWLQAGVQHVHLSTGAALVTFVVAVPVAWSVQRGVLPSLAGVGVVVAPLLYLAIRAGAGRPAS